jgi:hypothetical protein
MSATIGPKFASDVDAARLSVRSLARTTPYSHDDTRATQQNQRDCVSAGKTAAVSLLVVVTGPMASGKRTVAPSRGVRLRAADRSTDAVADVIQREHQ